MIPTPAPTTKSVPQKVARASALRLTFQSLWLAIVSMVAIGIFAPGRADAQATWRSSSSFGSGGNASTSGSLAKPSGLVAGDLMVMSVGMEGDTVVNTPTGWRQIIRQQQGSNFSLYLFWKIATAGDAAASQFSFSFGTSGKYSAGISRITGHVPTAPIAAFAGRDGVLPSASVVAPAVTTTAPSQLVLSFHATKGPATFSAASSVGVERYDVAGDPPSHALFSYVRDAAGSTGTRTATASLTETWAAVQVAIAGVVTPPTISTSGSIAAVNTVYGEASPTPSTFSISGTSLTSGITVAAPAGFEVSTSVASGFASSITVGTAGGIASTPVYIRLSSSAPVGIHSGNVTLSSSGAASVAMPITASSVAEATPAVVVVPTPPPVDGGDPGASEPPLVEPEIGSGVLRNATREELEALIAESDSIIVADLSFAGQDLAGLYLYDAYVRNVDFSRANLAGALFSDVNNFIPVELSVPGQTSPDFILEEYLKSFDWKLSFRGADLRLADFSDIYMAGSDFSSFPDQITILDGAKFDDSYFANINFSGVSAIGANFVDADLFGSNFQNAFLQDASFVNANLTSANLSGAKLQRVDFTKAVLAGINLSNADLRGATLAEVNFDEATVGGVEPSNLSGANLEGADLSKSSFRGANFRGANLRNANLLECDLTGADLTSANLEGADLGKARLFGANLTGANLMNASLLECDLSYARLASATLRGADISKANFTDASTGSGSTAADFSDTIRVDTINLVFGLEPNPNPVDPLEPVAGAPDANKSLFMFSAESIPADGVSQATITVEMYDVDGVRVTEGGATVRIIGTATDGTAGRLSAVIDNGDGTYSATITSSETPGSLMSFTVYLGSIEDSAFEIPGANGSVVEFFGDPVDPVVPVDPVDPVVPVDPVDPVVPVDPVDPVVPVDPVDPVNPEPPVAGAPEAGKCERSISSNFIPADGISTATITVELRDNDGLRITTGGETVSIFAETEVGTPGILSPVVDNGDGTYSATVVSSRDSTTVMNFTAYLGPEADPSFEIKEGSSTRLEFLPPSAFPSLANSTVRVSSSKGSIDGVSAVTVVVSLKDANGRAFFPTPTIGANVFVRTNFGTFDATTVGLALDPQSGAMVGGQFPGTYVAYLTSDTAGLATIDAFLGFDANAPKIGTAAVSFDEGILFPSLAVSELAISNDTLPAGSNAKAVVSVTLKDASGRPLRTGGQSVSIYQTVGRQLEPGTPLLVTDNGDGTYFATVSAAGAVAGQIYSFSAFLGVIPEGIFQIKGGPGAELSITAAGTTLDLTKSTIEVSSSKGSIDGVSAVTVLVSLKDANGNPFFDPRGLIEYSLFVRTNFGMFDLKTIEKSLDPKSGAMQEGPLPGTYVAYLTSDAEGIATVDAFFGLNANATKIGSATVSFEDGVQLPDLLTSELAISTDTLAAGSNASAIVSVTLKDATGEPMRSGGQTVSIYQTIGRQLEPGTPLVVTDNGDGTYFATVSGANAVQGQVYSFSAFLGVIPDGAFQIKGGPGAELSITAPGTSADLTKSTIEVSSSKGSIDGVSAVTVLVTLKDANGNPLFDPRGLIEYSLFIRTNFGMFDLKTVGTSLNPQVGAMQEGPLPGTYVAYITSDLEGIATIDAFLGLNANAPKIGTATVSFEDGVQLPDLLTSELAISTDTLSAGSNSTAIVSVTLKDAGGEPMRSGGQTVSIYQTIGRQLEPGTPLVVTDNGDGTYFATVSGANALQGQVYGFSAFLGVIPDGAFQIKGGPGAELSIAAPGTSADLTKSTIEVSSSKGSIDGVSAVTVLVTLKDSNGNPLFDPRGLIEYSLFIRTNFGVFDLKTVGTSLNPQVGAMQEGPLPGTYVASITSDLEGIATIDAFLGLNANAPKIGTATVSFEDGVQLPDLLTSALEISTDTLPAGSDAAAIVSVTLKDAAGEPLRAGGQTVSIYQTIGRQLEPGTPLVVTDNGDGTYFATVSGAEAVQGQVYSFSAFLGVIPDGAFQIKGGPGAELSITRAGAYPDLTKSTVEVSSVRGTADGATAVTVLVSLKDSNGNPFFDPRGLIEYSVFVRTNLGSFDLFTVGLALDPKSGRMLGGPLDGTYVASIASDLDGVATIDAFLGLNANAPKIGTSSVIFGEGAIDATISLGNLAATYDGTAKAATATTVPAGLSVGLTYNGSSTVPTAAGSYAVVGTVTDPNYQGTASGTLVISKGSAKVTLGGLTATFDGAAKAASAVTDPVGLNVNLTYDGSSTVPTAVGSYAVVATVTDPNYEGTASGTLVISRLIVAENFLDWQFSDADGTILNRAYNFGTRTISNLTGTLDNWSGGGMVVQGGVLNIGDTATSKWNPNRTANGGSGGAGGEATRTATLSTPLTSGQVVFEYKVANWNLGGTDGRGSPNNGVRFLVGDSASNSVSLEFEVGAAPGGSPAGTLADDIRVQSTVSSAGTIVGGAPNAASINATALVAGTVYIIATPGTTDWTLVGAANSNVGTIFTANATVGVGTGTANVLGRSPFDRLGAVNLVGSTANAVTLQLLADLDTGIWSTRARVGTSGAWLPLVTNGVGLTRINRIQLVVDASNGAGWQHGGVDGTATEFVQIDSVTLGTQEAFNKPIAPVTLGGLAATFNGSPRAATVTTVPAGLNVDLTYNGSATVPTNAGSYLVVAKVNDAAYQGTALGTLVIDKAAATVNLGNLSATYDATAKSASFTTVPAGLTVNVTYDGSATAPTVAGSYAVVAVVDDANYRRRSTGTLVIGKATATVTLGDLAATFDGTAKAVSATTVPAGLNVAVTYAGSASAPSAVGSYPVVATINDANYQGTASDTLVITADAAPTIAQVLAEQHGLTDQNAAPLADPDVDGVPNIVEYAFGSCPMQPTSSPQAAQFQIEPGSMSFSAVVCNDPNLIVKPEFSVDLSTWNVVTSPELTGVSQDGVPAGFTRRAWKIEGSMPGVFLRWQVAEGND